MPLGGCQRPFMFLEASAHRDSPGTPAGHSAPGCVFRCSVILLRVNSSRTL
ncbi:Hypothetical protein FKW44_010427 [Caligus rogercresseyi]|uniref:Uncharacterized protein n=1 Tax=Caligus rogercresseyi TaxID=217165 RepID=A0A7T8K9J2_CALRO|nr:Hypothetical protein FKW44_010427 [Caligus rogercresseyi]